MQKKADSWQAYNQAAIVQILLEKLPEIAQAVAGPLSKTERIVVINSGGEGAGTSKITRDVTDIIAQVPALAEALVGVDLRQIAAQLPGLAGRSQKAPGSGSPPEVKTPSPK
jgi:flotillin